MSEHLMTSQHNEIQVLHAISNDWSMVNAHFHDKYELNLSISGGNRFFVNDTVHITEPGDLFFLSPEDLHKNLVPQHVTYERYLIFFTPKSLACFDTCGTDLFEIFKSPHPEFNNKLSLNQEQLLEITTLLDDIIYHATCRYANLILYKKIKVAELLLLIHNIYHNHRNPYPMNPDTISKKVQSIIDYINLHLSSKLTIDHLAKQFYINKHYLCDIFKKETNFTINQHITNKRIIKSKILLKKGLTVTEVTAAIGYENDSHFIRTFKKLVEITPKQYALKHRHTKDNL